MEHEHAQELSWHSDHVMSILIDCVYKDGQHDSSSKVKLKHLDLSSGAETITIYPFSMMNYLTITINNNNQTADNRDKGL